MLSADLNHRYYAAVADWERTLDRSAKVFIAVTSSAAVSGWAIWGRPGFDWIWQSASALATLVAIALPVFDPAKSLAAASQLTGSWFALQREYDLLWARVDEADDESVAESLRGLVDDEKRLSEREAMLSRNNRIATRCERELRRSRGLPAQ